MARNEQSRVPKTLLSAISTKSSVLASAGIRFPEKYLEAMKQYAAGVIFSKGTKGVDADEVAYEAIVKIWRRLGTNYNYNDRPTGTRFRDFVKTVIRHTVIDEIRVMRKAARPIDAVKVGGRKPPEPRDVPDALADAFRNAIVLQEIEALDERERYIFKAKTFDHLKCRAIAEELRISEVNVRQIYKRAKEKLKSRLTVLLGVGYEDEL